MKKTDNYQLQAQQARERFLTYDQQALIRRTSMAADEDHLYLTLLSQPLRISRQDGRMSRYTGSEWRAADSHAEVMTVLDYVCDSRQDRHPSGRWKAMNAFGLMFHQTLLEERDVWAERFEKAPEAFRQACAALGGRAYPTGDIAYVLELLEGLEILVQLWFGDEEFPPKVRFLWDENALMYIRYETMWFAKELVLERIREEMARKGTD